MTGARDVVLWWVGAAVFLAICFSRLLDPASYFVPLFWPSFLFWLLPPLAAYLALRGAAGGTRELVWLVVFVTGVAWLCDYVHLLFVDNGHYFPVRQFANNTVWQKWMHRGILDLNPAYIPHSYRFLPDAFVGVLEWITGSYESARSAYRVLFYALLYAFVFRLARLYLSSVGSAAVIGILVMLYPVTNAWYAGQLVDPLSHASFVLCMWAMAAAYEAPIAPALIVGCLAKESVVVMSACRIFWGPNRVRALLPAVAYGAATVAVLAAVRFFVNGGTFVYSNVSGVEPGHLFTNLAQYRQWGPQYLFTLGVLLPGTWLGWRLMEWPFRLTLLTVAAGLIVSSAIFSWLAEARNLVPALVMMAIVNVRYVESRVGSAAPPAPAARGAQI